MKILEIFSNLKVGRFANPPLLILTITLSIPVVIFLSMTLTRTDGHLIMPLDDTYIHFQYARQFANGNFYQYNSADDPTSGGSSLLYPILLAAGYLVGFKGLNLAIWALVIGITSHAISTMLVYHLLAENRPNALLIAMAFAISGPFVWAALSGMETALFVCVTLATLTVYLRQLDTLTLLTAALAAIVRPEGIVIAGGALFAVALRQRRFSALMILPIIAVALQPLLNLMLTESLTASGNLAKSHLFNPTLTRWEQFETVTHFGWRIWRDLVIGRSSVDGWYLIPLIPIFALIYATRGLKSSWRNRIITPEVLALLWMLGLSVAIATLDTAFWHFKRYQLPIIALMFPLAGWFVNQLNFRWKRAPIVITLVILIASLWTTVDFAGKYQRNVEVVQNQQVAMAGWIDANLPHDARIAVHDVGLIRYLGGRATYDAVGLTTRDAAPAWRQGPGTLYEVMAAHENRPDFFAIYPDVLGLPFFVEAGVFGEELARFEMQLPRNTVASATGTQIVARANFDGVGIAAQPHQFGIVPEGFRLIDRLNVANLDDEAAHDYHWWHDDPIDGFLTELRQLPFIACDVEPCAAIDGGRVISGGERFRLPESQHSLLIVARVHAFSSARLLVGCGDDPQVRVVPEVPGHWVEIPILLEPESDEFCIESQGIYHPAHYWIYEGTFETASRPEEIVGTFTDPFVHEFTISLVEYETQIRGDSVQVDLTWFTESAIPYDGKLFVHLYDDLNAPPVAQWDGHPGRGALPTANWLPGFRHDSLLLTDVPPGSYTLALGYYDPASGTRYTTQDDDGRLILGEVRVQ